MVTDFWFLLIAFVFFQIIMPCTKCNELHACLMHSTCMKQKVFKPSSCSQCRALYEEAQNGNSEAVKVWKKRLQDLRARRRQCKRIDSALVDLVWASEEEQQRFGGLFDPASSCAFQLAGNGVCESECSGAMTRPASQLAQPFEGFESQPAAQGVSPSVHRDSATSVSVAPVVVASANSERTPELIQEIPVASTSKDTDVLASGRQGSEVPHPSPILSPLPLPSWDQLLGGGNVLAPPGLPGMVSTVTSREELVRSSPASSEPAIQRLRLPLDEGEWFTSEHSSVQEEPVRPPSVPAPVREEDPVADWFFPPEEAELVSVHPFKLRFKGLAFTAAHLLSKFLPGQLGTVTLIAPAQRALKLPEVAELFEYSSSYMPASRKVSRLASFRNLAKVFSEPLSKATGWVPEVQSQSLKVQSLSAEKFLKDPSLAKPSTPRLP